MAVAFPIIVGFRPFEIASKADAPDTFPKGRRCALGACGCEEGPVILSIFNPGETCAVCTQKIDRVARLACRN